MQASSALMVVAPGVSGDGDDASAIPEPVWPEADAYPAYRIPEAIVTVKPKRSKVDDYVLSAVVATGTVLVQNRNRFPRKDSDF
jgi:hypothetical protein